MIYRGQHDNYIALQKANLSYVFLFWKGLSPTTADEKLSYRERYEPIGPTILVEWSE